MIDVKEFIKENMMTEAEIHKFIEDLSSELMHQKQAKYIQKVDAVRELLQEMAKEYPNYLALEGDGMAIDKNIYWEDLIDIFEDTYHAY